MIMIQDDFYKPFAIAVQNADVGVIDNGAIEIIKECRSEEFACIKASGRNPIAMAKCFLKFGVCVAKGLSGCAKECLPNMVICLMRAHGNPMETLQWAMSFVSCAKDKCNSVEEVTAVSNGDIVEKWKQCEGEREKCMESADSIKGKAICYMNAGI